VRKKLIGTEIKRQSILVWKRESNAIERKKNTWEENQSDRYTMIFKPQVKKKDKWRRVVTETEIRKRRDIRPK
jgi:hypothetical protein